MKPNRPAANLVVTLLACLAANVAVAQEVVQRSSCPEGVATIEHLLLHFDPESGDEWLPACRDLVRSLPTEVRITIAVHGSEENALLDRMLAVAGIRGLEVVIVGKPLTPWARDRMVAVGNSSLADLLTPRIDRTGAGYLGDLAAAGALADRHGCRSVPVAMTFEGGDIVCSGKRAFIGWDTILRNSEVGNSDDTVRAFERLLCSEVVVVGRPLQPHGHVDMYLTVLDEETVLLGDPVAGRILLEKLEGRSPAVELPSFDTWTRAAQQAMGCQYDIIDRDLRRRGLRVLRVPILHGEQGGLLTWNNALVERRGTERRVYLPVYGVPQLDDAAVRVFREAGSRVFPIDVSGIAPQGGTVRCITNVVAWSSAVRPPGNSVPSGGAPAFR